MNWFQSLKLGNKLLFSFLVCAMLTLVVGAYGFTRISILRDLLDSTYTNNVKSLEYLSTVALKESGHNRGYARLPSIRNPKDKELIITLTDGYWHTLEKALASYRELSLTQEEREILAQLDQQIPAYLAACQTVLRFCEREKFDSAASFSLGKGLDAGKAVEASIDALMKINERAAAAGNASGMAQSRSAAFFMALILAVSFVCAILLGMFLTRNITRQLGGEPSEAVELVRRISGGDLTVSIETKSGDHTSLLYSMKIMVERLREISEKIRVSSDSIASASEEISSAAQSLSQGATEQAANVEETSASVEEISSTVSQNAENARVTDDIASRSAIQASSPARP